MPIIKRTTLPPVVFRQPGDFPFQKPGRPLTEVYKELRKKASDAAWAGDIAQGDFFDAQANAVKKRIDDGELYEVDF